MAVYTEVSACDLDKFLKHFDLGTALSFKGISEGVENSNYFLQTTQTQLILTLYEKRVKGDDLPYFLGLTEHLSQKGIPVPLAIRDKDGKNVSTLCGKQAALISFLQGVWEREPSPLHITQVGRLLAEIHLAARDYPLKRQNDLSLQGWVGLYNKIKGQCHKIDPDLEEMIAAEISFLQKYFPENAAADELPKSHIHADMFPDNVLFVQEELSGVIDFYFACYDFMAYDLAICLNAWCFDGGVLNDKKAEALLAGYQSVRVLTAAEKAAFSTLCRGAALRFLLTRAFDWINHDPNAFVTPKDPKEYSAKLHYHRRVNLLEVA